MLPCGRYYYAPEGGYVGNPWVKFSYQYAYIYMAWIMHHLDVIEGYCFQYVNHILRKSKSVRKNALVRSGNFLHNIHGRWIRPFAYMKKYAKVITFEKAYADMRDLSRNRTFK